MRAVAREMTRDYWDRMAQGYEDEIQSVLHDDQQGLIRKCLKRLAFPGAAVADIGCGIGHFLPVLSKTFSRVYANDISGKLLARARRTYGHLRNVAFLNGDICQAFKHLPKVDCALCVNSLISSSASIRSRMLQAVSRILKPGGSLVLVVPSLESALFVDIRFVLWNEKCGQTRRQALRAAYPKTPEKDHLARQGILPIDGVATKHFLKEELHLLLADQKLEMQKAVKIEYNWDTEFEDPPSWMREPYPWDWLVVARKKGHVPLF